jgi:hypothetical protein
MRDPGRDPNPNALFENTGGVASPARRFVEVSAAVGLSGARTILQSQFVDLDNDGDLDLMELDGENSREPVRIWKQQGGRFRKSGSEIGIEANGTVVHCVVADIDNDADPDLLLVRWKQHPQLFSNNGDGTFVDYTEAAQLIGFPQDSRAAAFLDFDLDGDLDLFVSRYAPFEAVAADLLTPTSQPSFSPQLFLNDQGRFAPARMSLALPSAGTLGVAVADFDRDGWPDLLLANGSWGPDRLEPAQLLLNQKGRGFSARHFPSVIGAINSQGAAAADVDGDGRPEIYLGGAGLFAVHLPPE